MKRHYCSTASTAWLVLFVFAIFVVMGSAAQAQIFSVLHSFSGQGDGGIPLGTPMVDAGGNFYGTTYYNGSTGWGTVYKLSPAGSGYVMTTLYTMGSGDKPTGKIPMAT